MIEKLFSGSSILLLLEYEVESKLTEEGRRGYFAIIVVFAKQTLQRSSQSNCQK